MMAHRRFELLVSLASALALWSPRVYSQSGAPSPRVVVKSALANRWLALADSAAAVPADRAIWQRRFQSIRLSHLSGNGLLDPNIDVRNVQSIQRRVD
jgi:hypothetical protein